jgi:hypothetical protein
VLPLGASGHGEAYLLQTSTEAGLYDLLQLPRNERHHLDAPINEGFLKVARDGSADKLFHLEGRQAQGALVGIIAMEKTFELAVDIGMGCINDP